MPRIVLVGFHFLQYFRPPFRSLFLCSFNALAASASSIIGCDGSVPRVFGIRLKFLEPFGLVCFRGFDTSWSVLPIVSLLRQPNRFNMTLPLFFAVSFCSGFAQRASALARGIAGHGSMSRVIGLHVPAPSFGACNLHSGNCKSDIPRCLHHTEHSKVQVDNMNLYVRR